MISLAQTTFKSILLIIRNNNAAQISNETFNLNLFFDSIAPIKKSDSEYISSKKMKLVSQSKINKKDERSEATPREDDSWEYDIVGVLKPWELWDEREIVVFRNPKTSENSDKHIVLPSGKEEDEDLTFLDTDSLVNVAPSRMSTYKSVSKMGENASAVVQSIRHLDGDKWSWRLDMLLIQAHEQFPGNWQKIAKVLKDK